MRGSLKNPFMDLKQAPRAWNKLLTSTLLSFGFQLSTTDPCLFWLTLPSDTKMWLNTYVDDIFLASDPCPEEDAFIKRKSSKFEITNLGPLTNPLGIEVVRDSNSTTLTQTTLAKNLFEEMGLSKCNPRVTPLEPGVKLEVHPPTS
jgi:hypothetical protein